jgi:hypothetical protein
MTKPKNTAVAVADPTVTAIAIAVEAGDIDSLKNTAAMASGLQKAAKARGLGIKDENKAAEVVLRAERGIGAVLLDLPRQTGDRPHATKGSSSDVLRTPIQEALGILGMTENDKRPSLYQALARIDDETFEGLLEQAREKAERIAKVDFYRVAQPPKSSGEVLPVEDATPVDRAYAAIRAAHFAILGTEEEPTNAFKTMHAEDLIKAAGFIKDLVAAYTEAKAWRGQTQAEREVSA